MIQSAKWALGAAAIAMLLLVGLLAHAAPSSNSLSVPPGARVSLKGGTVSLMQNGETGTFNCTCEKGKGSCTLVRMPAGLICGGGSADTCTGECTFFTTTTGASNAARAGTSARPVSKAP
jgi:hypothetical protein